MLEENDSSFDEEDKDLRSAPDSETEETDEIDEELDDEEIDGIDETDEDDEDEASDEETEEEPESKEKPKKSISADLIRGHINTIILRSLFDGDRYGYDIISEIEQKSHGQYELKQPTLYSALKRLENQGYIKSYWGGVSNGGRRRYFSLTEEGKNVVKQNQAEWEYSRTIIDNLISDEDFDFSRPVPQRLDFRILRQSTSRTPIVTDADAPEYAPTPRKQAEEEETEQSSPLDSFGGYSPALSITLTDPQETAFLGQSQAQAQAQAQSQVQSQPQPQEQPQVESLQSASVPTANMAATADTVAITNSEAMPSPQQPQPQMQPQPIEPYSVAQHPLQGIQQPLQGIQQSLEGIQQSLETLQPQTIQLQQQAQPQPQPMPMPQEIPPEEQPVPQAQPTQSEQYGDLPLYTTRSQEERNYKDIINKIYRNSIKQTYIPVPPRPQPQPQPMPQAQPQPMPQAVQAEPQPQPQPQPMQMPTEPIQQAQAQPQPQPIPQPMPMPQASEQPQGVQYADEPFYGADEPIEQPTEAEPTKKIDFKDLKRQAEADGLRVWISGSGKRHTIPEDFFNKGASLLKSSLFFFAVAIVECLLVILFKNDLFTSETFMIGYIATMLSITVAVPVVCAILYLAKYAPCCRRLKKALPIETGIVLFLFLFILLVAVDLLIGIKVTDLPRLALFLIIPGIYLLNILIFACVYYLFSKSKISK